MVLWNEWARTPGSFGAVSDQLDVAKDALKLLQVVCARPQTAEEAEKFPRECRHNVTLAQAELLALQWRLIYVVRKEVLRAERLCCFADSFCSWCIWGFWTSLAKAMLTLRAWARWSNRSNSVFSCCS